MFKKLLVIMAVFFAAAAVYADDIVNSADIDSLYTDNKAYKAGDIVTVLVVESSSGEQKSSSSTKKKQQLSAGMGMSDWGGGVASPFPYVPSWRAGSESSHDGGGKASSSGSLMGTISARVEKILSNGNLSIKGTKVITINDDKQNLIIKGVIRPQDISADNTIPSAYVADAHIEYEGKGPIGEKTSPGLITRFFDWLGLF
ncbi:MAG: flagellar basal body L-ring protein FlgH [Candidatus Goldiibacteriota bacterium]